MIPPVDNNSCPRILVCPFQYTTLRISGFLHPSNHISQLLSKICRLVCLSILSIYIYLSYLVFSLLNSDSAAAAAKLLQWCLTLCDPIDGSPPGSSVHGIFQARVLELGGIAFSGTLIQTTKYIPE